MTNLYDATHLLAFTRDALRALGLARTNRDQAAQAIWQATLRGVDSHGIRLLPHYAACVRQGRINPRPHYQLAKRAPTTAVLNAGHGLGHAAAVQAMRHALDMASEHGSGFVSVADSSHCGAMAFYAEMAAQKDMIGLALTNATPRVVPPGAAAPFLGTNPFCFSAPLEDEAPLTFDAATSLLPFNKVRLLAQAGLDLPEGCATDAAGQPTRDPDAAVFLQPFGGYKGFGISLFVEILCAMLTSMPFGPNVSSMFGPDLSQPRRIGHFFAAIDISGFAPPGEFRQRLSSLARTLRGLPRADDTGPMVPGDPEKRMAEKRLEQGIPLPEGDAEQLSDLAHELDLDFPAPTLLLPPVEERHVCRA